MAEAQPAGRWYVAGPEGRWDGRCEIRMNQDGRYTYRHHPPDHHTPSGWCEFGTPLTNLLATEMWVLECDPWMRPEEGL